MKQRLFRGWIKTTDNPLFAGPRANGGDKTGIGQFHETSVRFLNSGAITGVEPMPGVAGAIHHNLNCHVNSVCFEGAVIDFRQGLRQAANENSKVPITFVQDVAGYLSSKFRTVHLAIMRLSASSFEDMTFRRFAFCAVTSVPDAKKCRDTNTVEWTRAQCCAFPRSKFRGL